MSGFVEAVKIITLPALIAAFIYVLVAFIILPLYRRHRDRYNNYVPVDSILDTTSAVRSQLVGTTIEFFVRLFQRRRPAIEVADDGDDLFGEDEGETMIGFDLSHREQAVRGELHSDARLARDIEAGFKDDSDEELSDDRHARAR